MYSKILIATDGSELATKGLDHGLSLARALGAQVIIMTVTDYFPVFADPIGGISVSPVEIQGYDAAQAEFAAGVLKAATEAAAKAGVPAETLHVPNAHPAEAIIATAKARGAELVVMASHGRRGLGRLVLGSQTSEVLAQSAVPVLVVR